MQKTDRGVTQREGTPGRASVSPVLALMLLGTFAAVSRQPLPCPGRGWAPAAAATVASPVALAVAPAVAPAVTAAVAPLWLPLWLRPAAAPGPLSQWGRGSVLVFSCPRPRPGLEVLCSDTSGWVRTSPSPLAMCAFSKVVL